MDRECGELLHGRRFPPKLNGAVHMSHARPAKQYGSEAWCQNESEMGILQGTERSMVRIICGVQLKDRKRSTDLMVMLGWRETMDQLTMANSIRWNGHVSRIEDGHVLRRAIDFEDEGQRKKERPKRTWKWQVEEESVKIGMRREDALCRRKWSVGVNQIAAGLR